MKLCKQFPVSILFQHKSIIYDTIILTDCVYVAVGFNVETVSYKNLKFQVWDLGG